MAREYVLDKPIELDRNVWYGTAPNGNRVVLKGARPHSIEGAIHHELAAIVDTHRAVSQRTRLDRSPIVVQALDFTMIGNGAYIVLEDAGTRCIRDIADNRAQLFSALSIVADALAHVHFADLRYYDMKPSNVMLGNDNGIKLIDFGSCTPRDKESLQGSTGTVGYAPAKVLLGYADTRADSFSLGASTYELLTGKTLYGDGRNYLRDVLAAQQGKFRPWPIIPGVSPETFAVLKASTVLRSTDRPSLKELGDALRSASSEVTPPKQYTS